MPSLLAKYTITSIERPMFAQRAQELGSAKRKGFPPYSSTNVVYPFSDRHHQSLLSTNRNIHSLEEMRMSVTLISSDSPANLIS